MSLARAFTEWDEKPGRADTAARMVAAVDVEAARQGRPALKIRAGMQQARRSGMSVIEAVAAVRHSANPAG